MTEHPRIARIGNNHRATIDREAVVPLLRLLMFEGFDLERTHYHEPCAGDGALIALLRQHTPLQCVLCSDLEPRATWVHLYDALLLDCHHAVDVDCYITTPPWDRPSLHALIEHLSSLAPTFLLIDAGWSQSTEATGLMAERCSSMIAVGDMAWSGVAATKKENCAWYCFRPDKRPNSTTHFIARTNPAVA